MTTKKTTTPAATSAALVVRWATPRDMASQLDVERAWRHEKEDYWGADDLPAFLPGASHWRGSLVAEHPVRGVIGHMQFVSREKDVALLNVSTHPAYCNLGVARRLVSTLTSTLPRKYRRGVVNAVARERDLPTHLFLKACGFRCHACIPDFFRLPDDGGYHFQYEAKH